MAAPCPARLRAWRRVRDLSQRELAHQMHVGQNWIAMLETGARPIGEPRLTLLAQALDIPRSCLLDSSPDPLITIMDAVDALLASMPPETEDAA